MSHIKPTHDAEEAIRLAKLNLLKKYPHATLSKFEFFANVSQTGKLQGVDIYFRNNDIISTDITSKTFKHDKNMWIWLHNNVEKVDTPRFPKIWQGGGTIQPLSKGHKNHWGIWDGYPTENVLDYPVNNFKIFVNQKSYFMSKLPPLQVTTSKSVSKWDDTESYYRVVFAIYCATFCCGVSLQHLSVSQEVHPVVTSTMRFHVYFTIARLLRRMAGGETMSSISREFNASELYGKTAKIPKRHYYKGKVLSNGTTGEVIVYTLNDVNNDYKRYVPRSSDGLTNIGLQYLNQSIEAFVYSILGAQARTRVSVVGGSAGSLETQQEFRKLFGDSVVNYSVSTWILNMNKSIKDTNVVQNLAVSPSTWLMPSDMVILKNKIAGYNNLLKTATPNMKFGVNVRLNYAPPVKKKAHQDIGVITHHETQQKKTHHETVTDETHQKKIHHETVDNHTTTMIAILSFSAISGYLASKYMLK